MKVVDVALKTMRELFRQPRTFALTIGLPLAFMAIFALAFGKQSVPGRPGLSQFDLIAPGLLVFTILNMAPQAAAGLAREVETRTLERLRLTAVRSWELLGGVVAGFTVLGVASLSAALGVAMAMGYQLKGNAALGLGLAILAVVSVMGIGLIIASLARTQQEAANFGILVSVPASFLSGSFFQVPDVHLLTVGSNRIGLYDLLPTSHAVQAIRAVLTDGAGFDHVWGQAVVMVVLGAILFTIAAVLFTRTRLSADA